MTDSAWKLLSTSNISDAMDKLGISDQCQHLRAVRKGHQIFGPAFTVKYVPISDDFRSIGDFVDEVEPNHVIVIDNDGRTDCTVWGDLLTEYALLRRLAGTVIYGVCRDTNSKHYESYPVFCSDTFMRTGKDRVAHYKNNIPVRIGNTLVSPGDFIFGDDDGIVVIPKDHKDKVWQIASTIKEVEDKIGFALRRGESLKSARNKYEYYKLQRSNF